MNWQPSKCLEDPQEYQRKYVTANSDVMAGHHGKFALIILNQPIRIHRTLFNNLWQNGNFLVMPDWGIADNHWEAREGLTEGETVCERTKAHL